MQKAPLSIIIPAYNEENRLPPTLDIVLEWVSKTSVFDVELIIVDDGSEDQTCDIVRSYMTRYSWIKLVEENHVGAMHATISGFKQATSSLVANMEADCAVHPQEFEKFLPHLENHGIVMGSRILRGKLPPIQGKSPFRHLLSFGMSSIFLILFKCNLYDPQIGFKLFKKEALLKVLPLLTSPHDGIKSAEILVKAYSSNYSIKEIPVEYKHHPDSRCVPKGAFLVIFRAILATFQLWEQSYREYQDGLIERLPIRGNLLLDFWDHICVKSKKLCNKAIPEKQ
ncbi:MAG: glycosyltransferase [SAR324 cluster bacterium]|nr:glycosyltransferase [SAR324 cluster bacterium]